ncbi:helix-turn-helix domain-containing protein [Psychrobacillus sp. FSL H8-0484]|uniref:helix-turn-helix domain-containing protein n=1 Tax=Psychrobacillus sp. FSL H8-0484 TaxID=2921390 RepID=UPI0030F78F2F
MTHPDDTNSQIEKHYTRKEVADLLGISKVTVYHYAKQNKIRKVPDPHRTRREARYYATEVDQLAEQRKELQVEGYSTTELGKKLGISQQKIYQLIKEHNLPVHEVPHGDERIRYVIPEETAQWMKEEIKRTAPTRGIRSEFYDSHLNIALYQLFTSADDRIETRVVRNDIGEWGFYSSSRSWIPYDKAIEQYGYKAVYELHRPLIKLNGYTDFILPKENELSYLFLDYIYLRRGIENIRLREHDNHLALSVKAGALQVTDQLPNVLTDEVIQSFLVGGAGEVINQEEDWIFVSGYHKTSIELPVTIIETLHHLAEVEKLSFNELLEQALERFIQSQQP